MMDRKRRAFTLVELLVVIAIIGLLLSIALPALNKATSIAKVTRDRAALAAIAMGIETFATDMGFYPDSGLRQGTLFIAGGDVPLNITGVAVETGPGDQGAHLLYEAMAGLDTLGYQKDHVYAVENGGMGSGMEIGTPVMFNLQGTMSMAQRFGPYVNLDSVERGNMQSAHLDSNNFPTGNNSNPVFVDGLNRDNPRAILYYRAYKRGRDIEDIYNYGDNSFITRDSDGNPIHPEFDNIGNNEEFRAYLWDPQTGVGATDQARYASAYARPYNADSFILINAGLDGEYGTLDDLTNYTKK